MKWSSAVIEWYLNQQDAWYWPIPFVIAIPFLLFEILVDITRDIIGKF